MSHIVLIGSGRVAWHLGKRLKAKGLPVAQVINRTKERASVLAKLLSADHSDNFADIDPKADWLLFAVRDDAIAETAAQVAAYTPNALATHTSGATPGTVFAPFFSRYGVFYPLQTFSMERVPVWSKIPFCVDASNPDDLLFLKKTAKTIGNLVYKVDDAQRAQLHVAAVFANNFSNHCFSIAEKLMEAKGLPFELLHPLLEETLAKALQDSPAKMQTGPARRGDQESIQRHLKLLESEPHWHKIYEEITKDIMRG
jgi:predicted short-subunit dehydrogenase-like oxidoreductase (DUF2520 family)